MQLKASHTAHAIQLTHRTIITHMTERTNVPRRPCFIVTLSFKYESLMPKPVSALLPTFANYSFLTSDDGDVDDDDHRHHYHCVHGSGHHDNDYND